MADSPALKTPLQMRSRMRSPGRDRKGEQRRTRVHTVCEQGRTRVHAV